MKGRQLFASIFPKNEMLGPVNTNDDVVAAVPNEASQGTKFGGFKPMPAELVLTGPSQLLWPVAARNKACFQVFVPVSPRGYQTSVESGQHPGQGQSI